MTPESIGLVDSCCYSADIGKVLVLILDCVFLFPRAPSGMSRCRHIIAPKQKLALIVFVRAFCTDIIIDALCLGDDGQVPRLLCYLFRALLPIDGFVKSCNG